MAYNPNNAINSIYNLKGQWTTANASGDTGKANEAAQKAKKYYQELIDNGRGDIAKELQEKDYKQSDFVKKYYAMDGNTAFRPYLYNLGKKYGMSQTDIDKAISYNDTTGEVSLGGKNIGKPVGEYDGVSYWKPETLDKEFSDYVSRNGITRSDTQLMKEHNEGISSKINDLFGIQKSDREQMAQNYDKFLDYNYNHNPYESEIGKSIMEDYQWNGAKASANETASGAASNSGNIDSFSAANASRQQAAFTNMGKQAVREDFNQRIANIQNTLNNLGIYQQNQDKGMQTTIGLEQNESQRLFENDQTAKNNDVARKQTIASVTGVVPNEWANSGNPFLNDDGTLKYKDIDDYKTIIQQAEARGDKQTADYARVARGIKIWGDYKNYGQWDDGDYKTVSPQKTESSRQFDENTALKKHEIDSESSTRRYEADKGYQSNVDTTRIKADSDKYAVDAEKELGYAELGTRSSGSGTLNSTQIKSADSIASYINKLYKDESVGKESGSDVIIYDNGKYTFKPGIDRESWLHPVYYQIIKNANDANVAMNMLNQLGYTADEIKTLNKQYKEDDEAG